MPGIGWEVCRLYVIACVARLMGSVRAWRGLRFNERYAAKLEKKKARAEEKAKAKAAEQQKAIKPVVKSNPFSVSDRSAFYFARIGHRTSECLCQVLAS